MARSQFKTLPDFGRLKPHAVVFRRRNRNLEVMKAAGLGAKVARTEKLKALSQLGRGNVYNRAGQFFRF